MAVDLPDRPTPPPAAGPYGTRSAQVRPPLLDAPPPTMAPNPPATAPVHTAAPSYELAHIRTGAGGAVKTIAVFSTLVAIGLGVLAFLTARNGNNWRVEAENALVHLETVESRETVLLAENESLQALLDASERDVVGLEDRLREVANEKAVAQDIGAREEALRVEVERLAMLFNDCAVSQSIATEALVDGFNAFIDYGYYDANYLNRLLGDARRDCARADAAVDGLSG